MLQKWHAAVSAALSYSRQHLCWHRRL